MTKFLIIEVRDGILDHEIGARAVTCAGEQLADGFYFLPDAESDPPHRRPYTTKEGAQAAALDWLEEEEYDN